MSAYEDLVAEVAARPDYYTISSLMRVLIEGYGGNPAGWRKKIRAMVDHGALVQAANPTARFRPKALRLGVGEASVVAAVAADARARSPLASERDGSLARRRARDTRVGAGDDGAATAPTAPRGHPPTPARLAAEMDEWINAAWPTMSLSDRNYYDNDRLAREQRRGRYSGAVLTDAGRRRSERMPAMGQPGNDYRENW
jgi:hypothetical protein